MKILPCKKCNKSSYELIKVGKPEIHGADRCGVLHSISCSCPRKVSVVINASKQEAIQLWNRSQHD